MSAGPSVWALRLDPALAPALGPLRRAAGLEVCETEGALWVRGPADPGLEQALRALPAEARWSVDAAGELRPAGARLPVGRLPLGPWWPLARWLVPGLPDARDPQPAPAPLPLQLVRAGAEDPPAPPALLCLPLDHLAAWAEEAPALRLAPLELCLHPGPPALALVRGDPLPPLPGERFSLAEGVAVACGWVPRPRLDPGALALVLGLLPGEVALLRPDRAPERVPGGAFAPARRSAIRAALAGGVPPSRVHT